jgi:hypothetical protein
MDHFNTVLAVFERIPWMKLSLVAAGLFFAFMTYRYHKQQNRFNVWDMISWEGRADLYKVIVLVMAALTVWTVVWLVLKDKPVETLLLGALGIFVGGRAIYSITDKGPPRVLPPEDKGDK